MKRDDEYFESWNTKASEKYRSSVVNWNIHDETAIENRYSFLVALDEKKVERNQYYIFTIVV